MSLAVQNHKTTPLSLLSEIVPAARMLSTFDKLKLIRILAEELENSKDFLPLESGKTYDIATPYNMFGAADILANTVYQNGRG
jgi:hypothetical protein